MMLVVVLSYVTLIMLGYAMDSRNLVAGVAACNGHELGQTPGHGEGQGGLTCCSPRGRRCESVTEHHQQQEPITDEN